VLDYNKGRSDVRCPSIAFENQRLSLVSLGVGQTGDWSYIFLLDSPVFGFGAEVPIKQAGGVLCSIDGVDDMDGKAPFEGVSEIAGRAPA
jgi:hypothetical protein